MELYRLKHKPTGLYYQPVKGKYEDTTNLSKRGKIYQTRQNALMGSSDEITISVSAEQYNEHKEIFEGANTYGSYRCFYVVRCKKSDFEIEPV